MGKSYLDVWLAVNDEGECMVSKKGAYEACDKLVNEHGGGSIRTVHLRMAMALPKVTVVDVQVSDEAGETQPVEAAAE